MSKKDLAVRQSAPLAVTDEELQVVKSVIAKDIPNMELQLFFHECKRRGVHPLDRLLFPVMRQGKMTIQTSIDYLRSRADGTGLYDGQDPMEFVDDKDGKPISATAKVYKKGVSRPFVATLYFTEYMPSAPNDFMWRKMPHSQLGKCAEAAALRKAFPEQLDKLYVDEELQQAHVYEPQAGKPVVEGDVVPLKPEPAKEPQKAKEPEIPFAPEIPERGTKVPPAAEKPAETQRKPLPDAVSGVVGIVGLTCMELKVDDRRVDKVWAAVESYKEAALNDVKYAKYVCYEPNSKAGAIITCKTILKDLKKDDVVIFKTVSLRKAGLYYAEEVEAVA